MPYAEGRTFFDADSHVMELPGFLRDHADPGVREQLPELSFASGGKLKVAKTAVVFQCRSSSSNSSKDVS